jgi:hypothetical protein
MNSSKVTALAETVACFTNAFKYHKRKVPADEIAVVSLNCLTDMGAKYFNASNSVASSFEVPVGSSESVESVAPKKCSCGGH